MTNGRIVFFFLKNNMSPLYEVEVIRKINKRHGEANEFEFARALNIYRFNSYS